MTEEEKCVFCQIVNRTEPAFIEYETDSVIVIKDINPFAKYHFQAIPKVHIRDAKELKEEDILLVKELKSGLLNVLAKYGISENDSLLGFHWPPFNSVKHLHIAWFRFNCDKWSDWSYKRKTFQPGTKWSKTADFILKYLDDTQTSNNERVHHIQRHMFNTINVTV